jgi:hypothetical protein
LHEKRIFHAGIPVKKKRMRQEEEETDFELGSVRAPTPGGFKPRGSIHRIDRSDGGEDFGTDGCRCRFPEGAWQGGALEDSMGWIS